MPKVPGKDPSADEYGMIRSHRFAAANTFVPFVEGDYEQLEEVIKFLKSNTVNVSIVAPHQKTAIRNLLALASELVTDDEAPEFVYSKNTIEIQVVVTNAGVGHSFPGGTTDINESWIQFDVHDASGELIYHSGLIDENGNVDETAYFYRSVPVDRSGAHVWRHDLFNMTGETYKRTLAAGKSDVVSYSFKIPDWAQSPLTIKTALRYRKLNKRYTDWVMGANTNLPIVDMSWDSFLLPVKPRREVVVE